MLKSNNKNLKIKNHKIVFDIIDKGMTDDSQLPFNLVAAGHNWQLSTLQNKMKITFNAREVMLEITLALQGLIQNYLVTTYQCTF